jgi:hypothetical protein
VAEVSETDSTAAIASGIITPYPVEGSMNYEAINFGKKFGLFDEQWQPKVIAEMNDYQDRETAGRLRMARSQEHR